MAKLTSSKRGRYMKITAAKPSEARSSAKSGMKNLKSSNLPAGLPAGRQAGPKGSLLRAGGRVFFEGGIPLALQILDEICSNFFEHTPPVGKLGFLHRHSPSSLRLLITVSKNRPRT
jgi:hypothetical protein